MAQERWGITIAYCYHSSNSICEEHTRKPVHSWWRGGGVVGTPTLWQNQTVCNWNCRAIKHWEGDCLVMRTAESWRPLFQLHSVIFHRHKDMMHWCLRYVPRQTLLTVMYMLEKTPNKGNRPVGGDSKHCLNIVKRVWGR